jgi:hypothetical protein
VNNPFDGSRPTPLVDRELRAPNPTAVSI